MCLLCYKKMEIRKKHMKLTLNLKSSTMITNLSRHITHSSFIKRECFNSHDKQRSHTAFSLRFQGYTTNPYFVKLCGITKQALHKEREECLSYFPESIHAIFAFKVLIYSFITMHTHLIKVIFSCLLCEAMMSPALPWLLLS